MNENLKDMAGKVALVTGAARGIGRATALAFAAHGASVAVCDVLDDTAETVKLIEDQGGEAVALHCDVADSAAVAETIGSIVERWGRLDYAHNNAGIFVPVPLADLEDKDFERVIQVNLTGVFYCMKHEIRQMLKQGSGSIVNTASIWSFVAAPTQSAYTASKHGVMGLTRNGAADYGPQGIRINAVAPGTIDTPMTQVVPAEFLDPIVARSACKRIGQPDEIAQAVVWLCSDGASYVNGTCLTVDGGWLCA